MRSLGALSCCLLLCACEERKRPWEGPTDGGRQTEPFLPQPLSATLAGVGGGDASLDLPPALPSRAGGLWASCYAGFQPSEDPARDVVRLGLLCGPSNGMDRVATHAGELGGSARHDFPARSGECYRIFAVAAAASVPATELEVSVQSSRGSRLASDDARGRVVVLEPERPMCSFGDDTFTVELASPTAGVRYAVEIWRLPAAPGSHGD